MNGIHLTRRQLPGLLAMTLAAAALAACSGDDDNDAGFGLTGWPDGGSITLSDYAGEGGGPVVVNFLATWCPNCMEEMDVLQAVHASGVAVLGVNLRESAGTVSKLLADTGATFPIGLDETGKVTRAYKVVNLPGTAVLRGDGTIATVIRGPITEESLLEAVRAAEGG